MSHNPICFLFFLLCTLSLSSQSENVAGYLVGTDGNLKEGFIRNDKWLSNPDHVFFKEKTSSALKKYELRDIKEFGITNGVKYLKADIEYDISSHDLSRLTETNAPNYVSKKVFLKVLIEGNRSLYEYRDGSLLRYFIGTKQNIEQLLYKPFYINRNEIGHNRRYRQQLKNALSCNGIDDEQFLNLDYKKNDLVRIFNTYYDCSNQSTSFTDVEKRKGELRLSPLISVGTRTLDVSNFSTNLQDIEFESQPTIGFGIQVEYVFPFLKNKWALTAEPSYKKYTNQGFFDYNNIIPNDTLNISFNSLEIPVGLRYYINITDNAQLYINPAVVFNVSLDSEFLYRNGPNLEASPSLNLAASIGIKLRQRVGLELRYYTLRDLLSSSFSYTARFNEISLIGSYTLVKR